VLGALEVNAEVFGHRGEDPPHKRSRVAQIHAAQAQDALKVRFSFGARGGRGSRLRRRRGGGGRCAF
jgi:hypothetical protein